MNKQEADILRPHVAAFVRSLNELFRPAASDRLLVELLMLKCEDTPYGAVEEACNTLGKWILQKRYYAALQVGKWVFEKILQERCHTSERGHQTASLFAQHMLAAADRNWQLQSDSTEF